MRTIFTSTKFIALMFPATFYMAACEAVASESKSLAETANPLSLYGAGIDFDVYRQGKKVGYHEVRFDRTGEDLVVSSRFHLEIRFFFLSAYQYRYEAESRWREGQLLRLEAAVNDNGARLSLAAERSGDRITVRNADGTFTAKAPIHPTNHWNAAVLPERRVLNTLTGRINYVGIERRGREKVATEGGDVSATRYAYTGDLEADVWYDDFGRWVKLRFAARDGSIIEYACRRCQGPHSKNLEQAAR